MGMHHLGLSVRVPTEVRKNLLGLCPGGVMLYLVAVLRETEMVPLLRVYAKME